MGCRTRQHLSNHAGQFPDTCDPKKLYSGAMWLLLSNAPANLAANLPANLPQDAGSTLELFFGFMTAGAMVVMLLWLYFRTQQPLALPPQPPQTDQPQPPEPQPPEPQPNETPGTPPAA